MDVFMRQHMRMNSSEFQLPKEGSIYDYLYDTSRSLRGNQLNTATPSRWRRDTLMSTQARAGGSRGWTRSRRTSTTPLPPLPN